MNACIIMFIMHVFDELVEARIQEALERGDFENLPDAGRRLDLEDDPFIPEDMRLACRILKNAGYIPPEMELRRDVSSVESELANSEDAASRRRSLKKLELLYMKMDESRQRQANLALQQEYYDRILSRLAGC
ncbi:MAG: DnaJ family domain-containing protein [Gammaproteobacteria bacterium]